MSDSCCGSSRKSESAKVAMAPTQKATEAATEQPAANSHKNECCNDKPAKSEKHGCGC
jgi:hypothetical protein